MLIKIAIFLGILLMDYLFFFKIHPTFAKDNMMKTLGMLTFIIGMTFGTIASTITSKGYGNYVCLITPIFYFVVIMVELYFKMFRVFAYDRVKHIKFINEKFITNWYKLMYWLVFLLSIVFPFLMCFF